MPILQFFLDDKSPFTEDFTLSKNATKPDLIVQLLDGFTAVDLTGATVIFNMEDQLGASKVAAAAAVLEDGPNGKLKYVWTTADIDTEGIFFGQFQATISGKIFFVPNNEDQRLRIIVGARVN